MQFTELFWTVIMVDVAELMRLLPLVLPLVLLQLGLQVFALVDLGKRNKVRYDSRLLWALIILLGGIIGAAVYLIVGRLEDDISSID